jgi:hypothetical protein
MARERVQAIPSRFWRVADDEIPEVVPMNKSWTTPPPQPSIPTREQLADATSFLATMHTIERVRITIAFDRKENALVSLENPSSARLFELLWKCAREHGTVLSLGIRERAVDPASIARLNWFLAIHGYTRGFRGWKRARQSEDGGQTLWKCAAAWNEFKVLLKL